MRIVAISISLCLLSCIGPLHTTYTVPASADALACVLHWGLSAGYTPVSGGTQSGFLRLERQNQPKVVGPDERDVVTASVSHGQLFAEAATIDNPSAQEVQVSGRAKHAASQIAQACGAADTTRAAGRPN